MGVPCSSKNPYHHRHRRNFRPSSIDQPCCAFRSERNRRLTPDICCLSMSLMMVPAALLMTSCFPPDAAPPDWSKSCSLVNVSRNDYMDMDVPWHLQTWPYRRAVLSAWSDLSATRAYPTLHISTLLLNGLVLSTSKLLHSCHGGGADRQLRPEDDIDSLRSHAVSAHSLGVLLLVCLLLY